MSPLTLVLALLLLLLCSSLALASGSEPTLPWSCGDDQVSILETTDGRQNLSINGVLVQDRAQGCERLRSYFGSGCLSCDERSHAWRGAWMRYCSDESQSSYVTSAPNMPRRFLKQPSGNGAKAVDDPCGNMGLHENKHDASDSLEKEDPLLAVPGVLLLCCGLMLPCFHAERKEGRRHDTTSIQRNADPAATTDVAVGYDYFVDDRTPTVELPVDVGAQEPEYLVGGYYYVETPFDQDQE